MTTPSTTAASGRDTILEITPQRRLEDLILPLPVRRNGEQLVEEHVRADVLRSHGMEPRHRVPALAGAVETPAPFSFDAGAFGKLELSGGADGFAYGLTGAGNDSNKGLLGTSTSAGVQFLNGLVKLEKPDGLIRFTIEAGGVNLAHTR